MEINNEEMKFLTEYINSHPNIKLDTDGILALLSDYETQNAKTEAKTDNNSAKQDG